MWSIYCLTRGRELVAGPLAQLDGNVHFFAATIEGDIDAVARALAVQDHIHVELIGDFLSVNGHDDIAADGDLPHACLCDAISATNPGPGCRTAARDPFHEQAILHRQVQRLTEPVVDRHRFDTEKGAVNAAVGYEIVGDALRRVDRNGKADARRSARGCVNGGVDPDDLAARIDERAARIAAVDGGIGLNGFINEGGLAGLYRASQGADHARSEGALKAEGIANGQNLLANLDGSRITERKSDETLPFGIDFDEGDIIALVRADEFCFKDPVTTENDFDGLSSFDDMKIRENVSPRIDDEAGAGAFNGHRVHEKVVFRGFSENVGHGGRSLPVDAHVDRLVFGECGVTLGDGRGGGRACAPERHGFHADGLALSKACAGPIGPEAK